MTTSERARHDLFQAAEHALGAKEAETMMELLPTAGWSDVARQRDLDGLEQRVNDRIMAESALLRSEMADLRTELKTEMADLRTELKTEMAGLRTELKTEMAGLRGDFRSEFADFRAELHRDQRTMQRQIILALVVALVSIVLTTAGLG